MATDTLFSAQVSTPLADRLRPRSLDEVVGHADLIGPGKVLRVALERKQLPSMILWGPPGCGKTTLARVLAQGVGYEWVALSAAASGVAELREVVGQARRNRAVGKPTVLFMDEIHRFNKAQQDAFLPIVEDGTVTLIGATTENPSFEVVSALLSRCRVFVLGSLTVEDIVQLLDRALGDEERGLKRLDVTVPPEVVRYLATVANGDARTALSALELACQTAPLGGGVTEEVVREAIQRTHVLYDRGGEEHYNIISALHKSIRGSDANAALYWLGRMLEGGEDPLFIARRLIRCASEDIGLADPQALVQANAAWQACQSIGVPECSLALAQAVVYLARAPKSNLLYRAYGRVQRDVKELPNEGVPLHLRNAPTKLMRELSYGKGYVYPPSLQPKADPPQAEKLRGAGNPSVEGRVEQDYLPKSLRDRKYLDPQPGELQEA